MDSLTSEISLAHTQLSTNARSVVFIVRFMDTFSEQMLYSMYSYGCWVTWLTEFMMVSARLAVSRCCHSINISNSNWRLTLLITWHLLRVSMRRDTQPVTLRPYNLILTTENSDKPDVLYYWSLCLLYHDYLAISYRSVSCLRQLVLLWVFAPQLSYDLLTRHLSS